MCCLAANRDLNIIRNHHFHNNDILIGVSSLSLLYNWTLIIQRFERLWYAHPGRHRFGINYKMNIAPWIPYYGYNVQQYTERSEYHRVTIIKEIIVKIRHLFFLNTNSPCTTWKWRIDELRYWYTDTSSTQ